MLLLVEARTILNKVRFELSGIMRVQGISNGAMALLMDGLGLDHL